MEVLFIIEITYVWSETGQIELTGKYRTIIVGKTHSYIAQKGGNYQCNARFVIFLNFFQKNNKEFGQYLTNFFIFSNFTFIPKKIMLR